MGHKHQRGDILAAAVDVTVEHGFSQLSFGRVGAALGISDRTVVYYFPTKHDLISEVLLAVGSQLAELLDAAVLAPCPDHVALLRHAWPALAAATTERTFALFFEASGLAAAGHAPYDSIVPALVSAFVDWACDHLDVGPDVRRSEAEAAIAVADGLLLLRQLDGIDAARRAAVRLGIESDAAAGRP